MAILHILDTVTTYFALFSPDVEEANPIMHWLIENYGLEFALFVIGLMLKAISMIIMVAGLEIVFALSATVKNKVVRVGLMGLAYFAMFGVIIVYVYVVINNYSLIGL